MNKVIILLFLLVQINKLCCAQNRMGIDTTILVSKEKQIYETRQILIDAQNSKYLLGVYRGTTIVGNDTLITNSTSNNPEAKSIFVAKFDSLNHFIWANKIAECDTMLATSLAIDKSGNYYVSCTYLGTIFFGLDSLTALGPTSASFNISDIVILKYNDSNNLLFKNRIAGMNGESAMQITVDDSNNLLVAGHFNLTWTNNFPNYQLVIGADTLKANSTDAFIIKYDSLGVPQWAKSFGGLGYDAIMSICAADNKIYVLGGNQSSNISNMLGLSISYPINYIDRSFLLALDNNGNGKWVRYFGSTQIDASLIPFSIKASASQVFISGHSGSNNFNQIAFQGGGTLTGLTSGWDYFIASYDTAGNFKWNTISQSEGSEYLSQLITDSNSNVYGVGTMNYTLKFPSDTLNSNGGDDVFVCSYDSNGQFRWAVSGGGAGADVGSGIAKDSDGKLWIVGGTTSSGGCYMGNDTLYPPANQSTLFYASLDSIPILNQEPASIGQLANLSMSQFTVFPNPASASIEIKSQISDLSKASIELYNLIGQQVFNSIAACKNSTCNIDVSNLPNGMYFLHLRTTKGSSTQKIIVQH